MRRLRKSVIKWVVVAMICLLLGFLLGKFKQGILVDSLSLMKADLQTISLDKVELSKQLARIDAELMTEQQTVMQLTQENKKLNDELNVSLNKLYFYERVVSPESQPSGVKIYSFSVLKNELTGQWDYELVLMQTQKDRRFLTGKFDITFAAVDNEDVQNSSLSSLNETAKLSFKFKYFQTMKGTFILPPEMLVDEAVVQLNVAGNRWHKAQQIIHQYDWQTLIADDQDDSTQLDLDDAKDNEIVDQIDL
jgi:hypothetical protein